MFDANRNNDNPLLLNEKIATGEQQAFRQLFNVNSKQLVQFDYALIKIKEPVLEVVDEIFMRLLNQKEQTVLMQSPRMYWHKAVKNMALNYLSRVAHQQIHESFDYTDNQWSGEQRHDHQDRGNPPTSSDRRIRKPQILQSQRFQLLNL